jgi:hypothetical protein
MKVRVLLLLPFAICLAADPARETSDVVTSLAAALAARNAQEFLAPFDRKMPDYDRLRANVSALVQQADVQSYLDIVMNEGDDKARKLEIAWTLRIQRTGDATPLPDRDARITCRLERQGKGWRIVAFDPVAFLAPSP